MEKLIEKLNKSERTTLRLSDYIKIKHGFAFKGEYFSLSPTSDILVTPGNFAIGGGFKSDKFKYYKGQVPEDYILKANDLVVTMTDLSVDADTLGYSALIPKDSRNRYLHNQRVGLVQKLQEGIDVNFLYYLMRTRPYQKFVVSTASGSTVKHTSPDRIASYEYEFPPVPLQEEIAQVLSVYDAKIENNNLIINKLEATAQTLFDQWFVNFQFPGHEKVKLVDTEIGEIPEGWGIGKIKDLIRVESGFPFSSTVFDNLGTYKLVTIRNVQDGSFVNNSENRIAELPNNLPNHCRLVTGDILLSLTGNVGRVCLVVGEDYVLNQRVSVLIPVNERDKAYTYFYFRRHDIQSLLISISKGTAQLNLSPVETKNLECVIPSENLLELYSKIVTPIYLKIVEINLENDLLGSQRVQLLAKLT
jgi:type I restriction enzyme S subunit